MPIDKLLYLTEGQWGKFTGCHDGLYRGWSKISASYNMTDVCALCLAAATRDSLVLSHASTRIFSFGLDVANILCYICTHTVSCHEFTKQYILLNSSSHCSICLYLGCGADVCIIYPTVLKGTYQDREQQPTLFSVLKLFLLYLHSDL